MLRNVSSYREPVQPNTIKTPYVHSIRITKSEHACRKPIVCSLTDCSRLLASLGLTDKDRVRVVSSAKALVEATSRLLILAEQDKHVRTYVDYHNCFTVN